MTIVDFGRFKRFQGFDAMMERINGPDAKLLEKWLKHYMTVPNTAINYPKLKKKRTKMKHRKTLVKEENWALFDEWYLGPDMKRNSNLTFTNLGSNRIKAAQWAVRLAHQCKNGSISAPGSIYFNKPLKKGGITISGRCHKCSEPLSEKVKQQIALLEMI